MKEASLIKPPDWASHRGLLLTLTTLAIIANLALLWSRWCQFPTNDWNDLRLAPAIALYKGLPIYPTATEGVAGTWIYGPLPLIVLGPAALAHTAAGAVEIAGIINIGIITVAIALVCLSWPLRDTTRPAGDARVIATVLCIAIWPVTSLLTLQSDNLTIAFGLVGGLVLVRRPGAAGLWLAAFFAAGAMACKLTALGIPAAQFIWFAVTVGAPAALRQVGRMVVAGLILAGLSIALFGWAGLYFTLIEVPSRIPWISDPVQRLLALRLSLLAHLGLPLLAMLVWRQWFWRKEAPLLLPALQWLLSLPLGLTSILKLGGNSNSLHSLWLWLPPVVVTGLGAAAARPSWFIRWRLLAGAAAGVALGLLGFALTAFNPFRPMIGHYQQAEQISRSFPGAIWFPLYPTITLYSDGAYYHDEDGLFVRSCIEQPITLAHALQHLPPNYHAVALPYGWSNWDIAFFLIPHHAQTVQIGAWKLLTWPPASRKSPAP